MDRLFKASKCAHHFFSWLQSYPPLPFQTTIHGEYFMTTTAQVFSSLNGTWTFDRTFPGNDKVQGTAIFTPSLEDPSVLKYREDGLWQRENGSKTSFYREYTYRYKEEKISVYFEEKGEKLLFTLNFTSPSTAIGIYSNNNILHMGTYSFVDPNRFQLCYSIKEGPNREYSIQTLFNRKTQ